MTILLTQDCFLKDEAVVWWWGLKISFIAVGYHNFDFSRRTETLEWD